jgi:outer membrane protein TolC
LCKAQSRFGILSSGFSHVRRSLFTLFMAAALAACAVPPKLGPAPMPRAPVTAASTVTLAVRGDVDWPAADWWQAWGDSQLNALVAEALAGNPDIAAAEARVAAADAAAHRSSALELYLAAARPGAARAGAASGPCAAAAAQHWAALAAWRALSAQGRLEWHLLAAPLADWIE